MLSPIPEWPWNLPETWKPIHLELWIPNLETKSISILITPSLDPLFLVIFYVKDGIPRLFGFQVSDPTGLGFNFCVVPALYFVPIFRNIPKFGMVGFGCEQRA